MLMPALSIRQPWAWLIVRPDMTEPEARAQSLGFGIKDIENRNWRTRVRGGFLVHASKGMTTAELEDGLIFARQIFGMPYLCTEGKFDLQRGGIIGYAEITDCVASDPSPWFMGEYGFKLANSRPLPFLPVKGSLGFFKVEVPPGYLPADLVPPGAF